MNLKRISGIKKVENFLGSSVISQNPNVLLELWNFGENGRCFGVKNTNEISSDIIEKLEKNGYVWNTLDSLSDRGRALDLKLLNPITGKQMIGSSSGTAINVLYGLNDIGIGTDGGGSVLAPAIGVNLYSCLCSGIGLKGKTKKNSTDNINFTPGIGFIAGEFEELKKVVELFIEKEFKEIEKINEKNILASKDVERYLNGDLKNLKIEEIFSGNAREEMIDYLNKLFEEYEILIYLEEDIEVEGVGDTVFGCMGEKASKIQEKSGKKFIKVLNMIDASAVTIPTESIGTSIVIAGKKGMGTFIKIMKIAEAINCEYRPELYKKYFLNYPLAKIDNREFNR